MLRACFADQPGRRRADPAIARPAGVTRVAIQKGKIRQLAASPGAFGLPSAITQLMAARSSLFGRCGGSPAITAAAEFSAAMFAPPAARAYFGGGGVERQMARQTAFSGTRPDRAGDPAPHAGGYGSRAGDGDGYEGGDGTNREGPARGRSRRRGLPRDGDVDGKGTAARPGPPPAMTLRPLPVLPVGEQGSQVGPQVGAVDLTERPEVGEFGRAVRHSPLAGGTGSATTPPAARLAGPWASSSTRPACILASASTSSR
jgi:hypothetical protein